MTPTQVLLLEGRLFLILLAATLVWMMLTRRIATNGLLQRADGGISPERLQLLIATVVISGHLLLGVLTTDTTTMPEIDPGWLYGFGGSGALYAGVKAMTTMAREERRGGQR